MVVIYLVYILIFLVVFYVILDVVIPITKGKEAFTFFKKKDKNIIKINEEEKEVFDKE